MSRETYETSAQVLEDIEATLLEDALVKPEDLTINDWAQEMATMIAESAYDLEPGDLGPTNTRGGPMTLDHFRAAVRLMAPAAYEVGGDNTVLSWEPQVTVLADFYFSGGDRYTVAQLIQALKDDPLEDM